MANIKNLPASRPTNDYDFTKSKSVSPPIAFERASSGTCINEYGELAIVDTNKPRITHDISTSECLGVMLEETSTNLVLEPSNWIMYDVIVERDLDWYKSTLREANHGSRSFYTYLNTAPNTDGVLTLSFEVSREMTTIDSMTHVVIGYGGGYNDGYIGIYFYYNTVTVGAPIYTKISDKQPPTLLNATIKETKDGWKCTMTVINYDLSYGNIPLMQLGIYPGNAATDIGTGYQKFRHIQVEQLPYATSFIPTTTSTVTRAGDVMRIDNTLNQRSFLLEFTQPLTKEEYGIFMVLTPYVNSMVAYSQSNWNMSFGETINWPNVQINQPYLNVAFRRDNLINRMVVVCAEDAYYVYLNGIKCDILDTAVNGKPEFIKSFIINTNSNCSLNVKRVSSYQNALTDAEAIRLSQVD